MTVPMLMMPPPTVRTRFGDWPFPKLFLSTKAYTGCRLLDLCSLKSSQLRAGRLVCVHLDEAPFRFGSVYAVYAPSRHVPAKVRSFIDFLARRWAGTPPWDAGLPVAAD